MLVSLAIIGASLVLGVYWFRYVCFLILETRADKDHGLALSGLVRLNFMSVRGQLKTADGPTLDHFNGMLSQDYQVLSELLDDVGGVDPIERRMLSVNYRLLEFMFEISRRLATPRAGKSLCEMSSILNYFAGAICQAAASR